MDADPAELEAQPRARHLLVVSHLLGAAGRVQPRLRLHGATTRSHVGERQRGAELDVGRDDAPPALPPPLLPVAAVGHGIGHSVLLLLASEEEGGRAAGSVVWVGLVCWVPVVYGGGEGSRSQLIRYIVLHCRRRDDYYSCLLRGVWPVARRHVAGAAAPTATGRGRGGGYAWTERIRGHVGCLPLPPRARAHAGQGRELRSRRQAHGRSTTIPTASGTGTETEKG